jgi:two-component system, LytTR family, sensor kinase
VPRPKFSYLQRTQEEKRPENLYAKTQEKIDELQQTSHPYIGAFRQQFDAACISDRCSRRKMPNFKINGLTIESIKYNWFFRYRLYHLPFWFAYHTMWWILTIGSISEVATSIFHSWYFIKFAFYVVFQALGVYFNLYFLIPKFLEKGRYIQYVCLVVLTIACTAGLIVPGYYLTAWLSGKPFAEMFGIDPRRYWHLFQINTLPSSAASMTLAMSVKLTKNWLQTRQRERLLEKEKLETELKFLKSQFNPHFLFNTINSIFVLIHKNPDTSFTNAMNRRSR